MVCRYQLLIFLCVSLSIYTFLYYLYLDIAIYFKMNQFSIKYHRGFLGIFRLNNIFATSEKLKNC